MMKLPFAIVFLFSLQIAIANAQQSESSAFERLVSTIEQGDFSEAAKLITEVRFNESKLSKSQADLVSATEFYISGNSESSIKILERISNSETTDATRGLSARCLAANGKVKEAIALVENQEVTDRSSGSWTLLASLYLSNNQFSLAESAADSALNLNKISPDALFFRGFARWHLSKVNDALSDFDAAQVLRPSGPYRNEATPFLLSGMYYANQGNNDLAIRSFESALKVEPNSIQANFGMWKVYTKTRQHTNALPFAQEMAKLDPDSLDSISSNARTLMSLSKIGEAVPYLNKWYERTPKDPIVNQLFAHAYSAKPDYAKAFHYAALSMKYAPMERPTRSTFVKMGVQLINSEQIKDSGFDKAQLKDEICFTINQLCTETDWKRLSYLNLALKTFETFEQAEEATKVKQLIERTANSQSLSPALIKKR